MAEKGEWFVMRYNFDQRLDQRAKAGKGWLVEPSLAARELHWTDLNSIQSGIAPSAKKGTAATGRGKTEQAKTSVPPVQVVVQPAAGTGWMIHRLLWKMVLPLFQDWPPC